MVLRCVRMVCLGDCFEQWTYSRLEGRFCHNASRASIGEKGCLCLPEGSGCPLYSLKICPSFALRVFFIKNNIPKWDVFFVHKEMFTMSSITETSCSTSAVFKGDTSQQKKKQGLMSDKNGAHSTAISKPMWRYVTMHLYLAIPRTRLVWTTHT